ncbi:hypothetical protein Dimus_035506, partial [Dionaea muscipula]
KGGQPVIDHSFPLTIKKLLYVCKWSCNGQQSHIYSREEVTTYTHGGCISVSSSKTASSSPNAPYIKDFNVCCHYEEERLHGVLRSCRCSSPSSSSTTTSFYHETSAQLLCDCSLNVWLCSSTSD